MVRLTETGRKAGLAAVFAEMTKDSNDPPIKKVLKVRRFKAGYEVRTLLCEGEPYGSADFPMRSAFTIPDGHYLGDPQMARFLYKHGIRPELANKGGGVCSVGFCLAEMKWYGYSHRATHGFGIGDRIFEAKYGNDQTPFVRHGRKTIRTLQDARRAAVAFARYVS